MFFSRGAVRRQVLWRRVSIAMRLCALAHSLIAISPFSSSFLGHHHRSHPCAPCALSRSYSNLLSAGSRMLSGGHLTTMPLSTQRLCYQSKSLCFDSASRHCACLSWMDGWPSGHSHLSYHRMALIEVMYCDRNHTHQTLSLVLLMTLIGV